MTDDKGDALHDGDGPHNGDGLHDGDGRSPSGATDNSPLGVTRVRPHRDQHPPAADGHRDEARSGYTSHEPAGFEPRRNREVPHERWKAMAVVCFVLVTLATLAGTGVQIAAAVDVLALGPDDLGFLRRIDSALTTTATRAQYVAVAAGGFAVVVVVAAALAVAVRATFDRAR